MKIKRTFTWVESNAGAIELKRPSKKYRLVNVVWERKNQRSALDGSGRAYTKITAYWVKE